MPKPENSRKPEPQLIDIEKKNGLLEELNLPPQAIKFIRSNSKNIQIVVASLVILILAWSYYDYYNQAKKDKAALALSTAVEQKDNVVRLESLSSVAKEYSGTSAALWGRLEEGHLAFQEGRYAEALAIYQDVHDDLSRSNPLRPLVLYALAMAHENGGQLEQALVNYQELAENEGFKSMALFSEGRVYELLGDQVNALRVYRQVAEDKDFSSQNRSLIEEKINTLQANVPGVTG